MTPLHSRDSSLQDIESLATGSASAAAAAAKVRFKLSEEEANSTNPSDSNNSSNSHTSDSVSRGIVSGVCGAVGIAPGMPLGQATSRQISMLSTATDGTSASSNQADDLGLNPYRKYVDKYLKTKGKTKYPPFNVCKAYEYQMERNASLILY